MSGKSNWLTYLDVPDEQGADDLLARYIKRTQPHGEGCLIWLGPVRTDGAPADYRSRHNKRRVAPQMWTLRHRDVLGERVIHHTCGLPRCIAPKHLEAVRKRHTGSRIIGTPLPCGVHFKDAGYMPVHHPFGPTIWEPADIAAAVNQVLASMHPCRECGDKLPEGAAFFCNKGCRSLWYGKLNRGAPAKAYRLAPL